MPILPLLGNLFGANGLVSVQAVADLLSMLLAVPILRRMKRVIDEAQRPAAVTAV